MSQPLQPHCSEECVLGTAEAVGRRFREEKAAWEQTQWAKNNATFSWRAAAPLRAAESVVRRFSRDKSPGREPPQSPPLVLTPAPGTAVPDVDASLSVVIPTLNAGEEFAHLLRLLRLQSGFASLEIVVVDSGSGDGTPALAEQYGAMVVPLPQAEFTHAHARNLGADAATGDYLLFMTQDALPEGGDWARRMLEPVLKGTVQAVSCTETPRPDADLYSRAAVWSYEQELGRAFGTDYIGALPREETYLAMMQNAGLGNVACGMAAATFAQYRFRGRFAEDLDFGIRLLRGGGKTGFLSSVRVVHSHNRPAYYFLKRSVVNVTSVSELLPAMPLSQLSAREFVFCALGTWKRLSAYLQFLPGLAGRDLDAAGLAEASRDFFSGMDIMGYACRHEEAPAKTGDDGLDGVVKRLWRLSLDEEFLQVDATANFFHSLEGGPFAYLAQQGGPFAYLAQQGGPLPGLADIVVKKFAIWLGEGIAALARREDAPALFKALAEELCQGV